MLHCNVSDLEMLSYGNYRCSLLPTHPKCFLQFAFVQYGKRVCDWSESNVLLEIASLGVIKVLRCDNCLADQSDYRHYKSIYTIVICWHNHFATKAKSLANISCISFCSTCLKYFNVLLAVVLREIEFLFIWASRFLSREISAAGIQITSNFNIYFARLIYLQEP